jgi:hypothetical protein
MRRDPDWRLPLTLNGIGFITEDRRLLKAFPALARTMQSFIKEFRS